MWVFKCKELRPLLLSAAEWESLRQLGDILAVSSVLVPMKFTVRLMPLH